jgi:biotin carboxyl carrier protein
VISPASLGSLHPGDFLCHFHDYPEGSERSDAGSRWARRGLNRVSSDPLLACAGLTGDELDEMLALVAGTDICELDVTLGSTRFSLRRPATPASVSSGPDALEAAEPSSLAITSPLVGIFRPSVTTGETVQPGQSIGAIEALGMPSSVDAPQGGTVEELLVHEGGPVEYGQPLLILHRTGPHHALLTHAVEP